LRFVIRLTVHILKYFNKMARINIRKGFDIRLKGKAEKILLKLDPSAEYALKPSDFHGITPKLMVKEGDKVKAGTCLFSDKNQTDIAFTSPVSGTVEQIKRGDKRLIESIVIKADATQTYESFGTEDAQKLSREDIIKKLMVSGCWPYIKQRPFDIIANPAAKPKAIFISAFDTAPLAPDIDFIVNGMELEFQTGINVLAKLTEGSVHLNVNINYPTSHIFAKAKGVELSEFSGPHPAGNVGVHIHHLMPINKGEEIWTVGPQDVIIIGKLFLKGIYDSTRVIALTGSEVNKPRYFKLISGANLSKLIEANITSKNARIISGNVLTGSKIDRNGFLGFYDSQVTAIPEGKHFEFLGWADLGFNKFSFTRSFFSSLIPGREFTLDTNLNGGNRSYVMTGQFEKVLPMDIYPLQLIKSILAQDIEQMEKLGIYEVAPEDFALCEYIDTSKTEIQAIIREGLDLVKKEMC